MNDSDQPWKTVAFFVAIVAGIAVLLVIFVIDWPRSWEAWGGGVQSPAEVFASILTPIGALVAIAGLAWNIRNSDRTLRQSQQAEQASRFKIACEMLGSPQQSISIAGGYLLRATANAAPEQYLSTAIDVLAAFVAEADLPTKELVEAGDVRSFPISDARTTNSLEILSSLRPATGWPDGAAIKGKLPIGRVYVGQRVVHELRLSDTLLTRWVLHQTTFANCDFSNSELVFVLGHSVVFRDCLMTNTTLVVLDSPSARVTPPSDRLRIVGGEIDGLTVNGQTYPMFRIRQMEVSYR